jgi:hypothetical protein
MRNRVILGAHDCVHDWRVLSDFKVPQHDAGRGEVNLT